MQFFYTRLFSIRTFLNILSTTFAQPFTGCPQPFAQPPSDGASPVRRCIPRSDGASPAPIKKIRLQKRGGHLPKKTAFPAFQPNLRFENFALKFEKKTAKGEFFEVPYPKKTEPCWSMARIDLHSEQRNRPLLVALSLFEQTGQLKILGNTLSSTGAPLLKKLMASPMESLMLKNWLNPSSWNTSYTFG